MPKIYSLMRFKHGYERTVVEKGMPDGTDDVVWVPRKETLGWQVLDWDGQGGAKEVGLFSETGKKLVFRGPYEADAEVIDGKRQANVPGPAWALERWPEPPPPADEDTEYLE